MSLLKELKMTGLKKTRERVLVSHNNPKFLKVLSEIKEFREPKSLFKAWSGSTSARKPDGITTKIVDGKRMFELYKNGHMIYLHGVQRFIPALRPLMRNLERELGLRRGEIVCEAVLSKRGYKIHPHFDPSITINVQIWGEKTWYVSPNEHVSFPHIGLDIGKQPVSELAAYSSRFPSKMPTPQTRVRLKPGSALFLPHGYWHRTVSHSDSFSLFFTIRAKAWADLFVDEMQALLRNIEDLREVAFLNSDCSEKLSQVLKIFKNSVNELSHEDLLRSWRGPPSMIMRPQLSLASKKRKQKGVSSAVLNWIKSHPDGFHLADAIEDLPKFEAKAILRTLYQLQAEGVLS